MNGTENHLLSFEQDIKSLFRRKDIRAMINARNFDLSSYADVVPRADRILEELEIGRMPCDGAWPPDQVDIFRQWIIDGKQP